MMLASPVEDPKRLTLRQIYERYKKPGLIGGQASPRTLETYKSAIACWERLTDNPPVGAITNETLARFRAAVLAGGLRPVSFNKYWVHIRAVLRRIGPPETRNPLGEGILERVPYVESLRHESELPRIATPDELNAIYEAAARMTWPPSFEVPPAEWWRALYAVGLGHGPRIFDLLRLRTAAFDLEKRTLRFRANKTRKWHVLPIGDVVAMHVRRISSDRPHLFVSAGSPNVIGNTKRFYEAWHELQDLAGIRDHFGTHTLRRTCGSLYFRHGGFELASYVLGHSLKSITMRFYVDPSDTLRDVADKLEWPAKFREIANAPGGIANAIDDRRRRFRRDWRFGVRSACFRGRRIELPTRPHAILRALVAAGRPLSIRELATTVWPDRKRVDRNTVKGAVHRLRTVLIDCLELPAGWDPVPFASDATGWQLQLPDE